MKSHDRYLQTIKTGNYSRAITPNYPQPRKLDQIECIAGEVDENFFGKKYSLSAIVPSRICVYIIADIMPGSHQMNDNMLL